MLPALLAGSARPYPWLVRPDDPPLWTARYALWSLRRHPFMRSLMIVGCDFLAGAARPTVWLSIELSQLALQVLPGASLVAPSEVVRQEDRRLGEGVAEEGPAAASEQECGNAPVLSSDAQDVALVRRWVRAEDRHVRVQEQLGGRVIALASCLAVASMSCTTRGAR